MDKKTEKLIDKIIDGSKVAYLASVDMAGFPAIRCMLAPRRRVGVQSIFFSTNTSSQHVQNYRVNPRACLYFCDERRFRGVALTGTFEILEDAPTKEMLWEEGDTKYYSLGVTDPDYCVLRFVAQTGRFYGDLNSQDFIVGDASD